MDRLDQLAGYYVAFLRVLYLTHQNSHWLTRGSSFYGDHLMFERLYKEAQTDGDSAAERFIGLFGDKTLDLNTQAQFIHKIMEEFISDNPVKNSLDAEKKFLEFAPKFVEFLKKEDKMTLGLEDLLPEICAHRETACYLLQQTLQAGDESNSKHIARMSLLGRVKNAIEGTQDLNSLQPVLLNELRALIPSYVPGTYADDDITIDVEAPHRKIFGHARLPKVIGADLQHKLEKMFQDYAAKLLQGNVEGWVIGLGMEMPQPNVKAENELKLLEKLAGGPKWVANPKKWDRAEKIMKRYKKRYGKNWFAAVADLYLGNLEGKKNRKKGNDE